jgi:hypothetical protein
MALDLHQCYAANLSECYSTMELPNTILCHHCGAEAKVPPQHVDENVLEGQLEGYDQEGAREGYLVVIECPHCGRVRQRLTAADA